MNVHNFRQEQQNKAVQDLNSLFWICRYKFLKAASLLELKGPVFDKLQRSGWDAAVDMSPLINMFGVLCERYVAQLFTPYTQQVLSGLPDDDPDIKWRKYFHHVLVPHLIQDDEFVRNVLRATMTIPCKNPQLASEALVLRVSDMTLPETKPPWDYSDCLTIYGLCT